MSHSKTILFAALAISASTRLTLADPVTKPGPTAPPIGNTSADSVSSTPVRLVDTQVVIPKLDFSGVPLADALGAISRAYKLSLFVDSTVTGSLSMRLENVSLNDALLFIVKQHNLS